MADGLNKSGQREAIARIADPNHPIEALERPLVVAPFVLKISGDDEKSATLRRIDLWFIAYGKLDRLADESFWKSARESLSGGEKENRELSTTRIGILSADDLKTRGLKDPETERHLTADMALFNRVRICATMQAIQTRSADSLVLAAMLDPRFAADEQFPNCWRPISRDDNGRQHIGAAQPYRTAGWYCKATQLHEPAGALFVEFHVLFDEPVGWFNGELAPLEAADGRAGGGAKVSPAARARGGAELGGLSSDKKRQTRMSAPRLRQTSMTAPRLHGELNRLSLRRLLSELLLPLLRGRCGILRFRGCFRGAFLAEGCVPSV